MTILMMNKAVIHVPFRFELAEDIIFSASSSMDYFV